MKGKLVASTAGMGIVSTQSLPKYLRKLGNVFSDFFSLFKLAVGPRVLYVVIGQTSKYLSAHIRTQTVSYESYR